jgi:hypothetical protein
MARLEKSQVEIGLKAQEPQIINWQVKEGKIITLLNDGREIITPVQLLTKWGILDNDVKPEQLIKYEIKGGGNIVYFPDIDDVLPTRKIIKGLHTC